jgi:hypothetical protein
MKWLLKTIAFVRVFFAAWKYPDQMSAEQRQRAIDLIKKCAELDGLDTFVSDRYEFSSEIIEKAPRERGVYRIYEGNELKYIGASCRSIQDRLSKHYYSGRNFAAGNVDKARNKGLADLIASGRAIVEWYVCPFAGWVEDYELTEYCEEHGQPPPLNYQRRSGLIEKCFW